MIASSYDRSSGRHRGICPLSPGLRRLRTASDVVLQAFPRRELGVSVDHVRRHEPADVADDAELTAVHDAAVGTSMYVRVVLGVTRGPHLERGIELPLASPGNWAISSDAPSARPCSPSCCSRSTSATLAFAADPVHGFTAMTIVTPSARATAVPPGPVSRGLARLRVATGAAVTPSDQREHHDQPTPRRRCLASLTPFFLRDDSIRRSGTSRVSLDDLLLAHGAESTPIAWVIRSRTTARSTIAVPATKPSPISGPSSGRTRPRVRGPRRRPVRR